MTSTRRRAVIGCATAAVGAALVLATAPAAPAEDTPPTDTTPFTFVVIPDTQSYAKSTTDEATIGVQTRWIRDQRAALNTAFVSQVGDLVESHPSNPMWQRVSGHLKVLDDAGVPNAVLPGNHDMDLATGKAAKFDTYFPPSRYQNATWTPSTSRYGGYLGQNQFGTDPVDRGNKDSYSLFSAGGMDFLSLNLEYESPAAVLAWAQKVLDNHPGRRVIVSTHGFVDTRNKLPSDLRRTDQKTSTPQTVWDRFISRNCQVFLVVNGHWTDPADPTRGEGRLTQTNACGRPVHAVLSNYQHRPNGGDGWLRYYTFDPASDTISARTYSPTLDRFETDADSEFTLPYDMHTAPVPDRIVHAGFGEDWRHRFETGAPASTWTANGYNVTAWKKGPAPLGFGAYGPATSIDVPAGTTRPISAQLRRYVNLTGAAALKDLTLTVYADDGVTVWINGKELGRSNMPAGTIAHDTYATVSRNHATSMSAPLVFKVPAGYFKDGTNTIAAQVSSNYRATSDMTFDAMLTSMR